MNRRSALLLLLSLVVVVPLGFGFKWYRGPWHLWFNNYGAAIWYEVFWCLAIALVFPSARDRKKSIAATVLLTTSLLEFLQLYTGPPFDAIRSTRIGAYLVGTTFVAWDFFYYLLGSALGYLWLCLIIPDRR